MTTIIPPTTRPATTTAATDLLLTLLDDALSAIAETDPAGLHARTRAGGSLVSLASVARRAAGALGADPGEHLTEGPGVVVVRDLVAATRLLARASSRRRTTTGPELGSLTAAAKGIHARLLETLTTGA